MHDISVAICAEGCRNGGCNEPGECRYVVDTTTYFTMKGYNFYAVV